MSRFLKSVNQACLTLCMFSLSNLEAKWYFNERISSLEVDVANGMDASGNTTAIWTEWYSRYNSIYSSNLPKGNGEEYWRGVETVVASVGHLFENLDIAVDSSWNSVAVWQEYDGTSRKISATTRPFRGKWSVPIDLSTFSATNSAAPQVAISPDGYAVVVWTYDGILKGATYEFGGDWSTPVDIAENASSPQIKIGGAGNAIAVWLSDGNVKSSFLPYGGKWSSPVNISNGDGSEPQLAMNPSGLAVAAWKSENCMNVSHVQFGQNWTPPVQIKGSSFINQSSIAVNLQGNALLVWEQQDLDDSKAFPIISPNYLQASYFSSNQWSPPVTISAEEYNGAHNPQIAFDGLGNALVVWNSYSEVRAATQSFQGEWAPPITIGSGPLGLLTKPQICVDSSGYAVINWFEESGLIKGTRWIPDPEDDNNALKIVE